MSTGKGYTIRTGQATAVGELAGDVLAPVLKRRAGMTLDLLTAWPEIAGQRFSSVTRPVRINWPRRANEEDPFRPAVLVVACEPSSALFFQYEHPHVLERANLFFGFAAIERIQILQKPVSQENGVGKMAEPVIGDDREIRLQAMISEIEDPDLREALARLGRGVIASVEE